MQTMISRQNETQRIHRAIDAIFMGSVKAPSPILPPASTQTLPRDNSSRTLDNSTRTLPLGEVFVQAIAAPDPLSLTLEACLTPLEASLTPCPDPAGSGRDADVMAAALLLSVESASP